MNTSCKSCQCHVLVKEGCDIVCTQCGQIQADLSEEGQLCMLSDNQTVVDNFRNKQIDSNKRLTGRIRGETSSLEARRRLSREKLLEETGKLVRQLVKQADAVHDVMDLAGSVFMAHTSRLLNTKRLGLVGACIFHVNAKHKLGISLAEICKTLNVRLKIVSGCIKEVKQLCPGRLNYQRPNIKDLVKRSVEELATKKFDFALINGSCCAKDKLQECQKHLREAQPLIHANDRLVLETRIMLLIDLFEAMHPYHQPTPQSLITAVMYHAWRSLDTFKMIAVNLDSATRSKLTPDAPLQATTSSSSSSTVSTNTSEEEQLSQMFIRVKHKVSFEKFCQICDLKCSGYKIVSKLQSSLVMLGRQLGDVNKINLPWYIKDIIENSSSLMQERANSDTFKADKLQQATCETSPNKATR